LNASSRSPLLRSSNVPYDLEATCTVWLYEDYLHPERQGPSSKYLRDCATDAPDAITTVRPTYANGNPGEAGAWLSASTSCCARSRQLHGLLNGIDIVAVESGNRSHLACPYVSATLQRKALNQSRQASLRLSVGDLSRCWGSSACSRIKRYRHPHRSEPRISAMPAQVIVIRPGRKRSLSRACRRRGASFRRLSRWHIGFDEAAAHLLESAPFVTFPCRPLRAGGMNQLHPRLWHAARCEWRRADCRHYC